MRNETRRERYHSKKDKVTDLPLSIATINFKHEVNLAYVIRASACFGSPEVFVIGDVPPRKIMNELSGTTFDFLKVNRFSNTSKFLSYIRDHEIKLISIELPEADSNFKAYPLEEHEFDFTQKICAVVGNETIGVPTEILHSSDKILYINMPGAGFCLNTSQSANIVLYEAAKQFATIK